MPTWESCETHHSQSYKTVFYKDPKAISPKTEYWCATSNKI